MAYSALWLYLYIKSPSRKKKSEKEFEEAWSVWAISTGPGLAVDVWKDRLRLASPLTSRRISPKSNWGSRKSPHTYEDSIYSITSPHNYTYAVMEKSLNWVFHSKYLNPQWLVFYEVAIFIFARICIFLCYYLWVLLLNDLVHISREKQLLPVFKTHGRLFIIKPMCWLAMELW